MKKILSIPIFAVMLFSISLSIPQVFADASITLDPTSGPSGTPVKVSGSGFAPTEIVICIDGQHKDTIPIASGGSFSDVTVTIIGTQGQHSYQAFDGPNCANALSPPVIFTINSLPPIPEFPFSFSLVIMFVVVAAVYVVIRQKMSTGFFKPF